MDHSPHLPVLELLIFNISLCLGKYCIAPQRLHVQTSVFGIFQESPISIFLCINPASFALLVPELQFPQTRLAGIQCMKPLNHFSRDSKESFCVSSGTSFLTAFNVLESLY